MSISRKDIWTEVGINMIVRGAWALFFLVMGILIHDIHNEAGALILLILGTTIALALCILFEYRRAAWRLRRQELQDVVKHRDEINEGVRAALSRLDGSSTSAVALLADLSPKQLDEYGGMTFRPLESQFRRAIILKDADRPEECL